MAKLYAIKNNSALQSLAGHLRTLHEDEQGATATEYLILLILIAIAVIAAVKIYGIAVSRKYQMAEETVRKKLKIKNGPP